MRLTEFEHVVTGPAQSLLRVCGSIALDRAPGQRPVLVMETAGGEARFHPLRAPDDRSGVIRAAYTVPTSLVTEGARCELEMSDGARIELPVPVEGAGRLRDADDPFPSDPSAGDADSSSADAQSDPTEALRDAESQIRALAQNVIELERARDDDHRVAAAVAAQADGRAHSAEEREAAAEGRAQAAEQATQVAQAQVSALETELAAQAPARESLREEISSLQSRWHSLERELDQCRDQLRIMTFERDELERQAAAFDAVAVKARERATAAEAANERSASTLDELQIWRTELERRLADTTTELGGLRATRDADERELVRLRDTLAEHERRESLRDANGADPAGGDGDVVVLQAAEIQRLAAELAELRSRTARDG